MEGFLVFEDSSCGRIIFPIAFLEESVVGFGLALVNRPAWANFDFLFRPYHSHSLGRVTLMHGHEPLSDVEWLHAREAFCNF